jgi:Cft2 family RNA processing exonuclease
MLYMIIEKFHEGKVQEIYKTLDETGRQLPDGLVYINSWINEEVTQCWQVMECDDPKLLTAWIDKGKDLVDFEIIPVTTSEQARQKVLGK